MTRYIIYERDGGGGDRERENFIIMMYKFDM